MFNEDKTIAAAQKVMLEILQEIHKICVENKNVSRSATETENRPTVNELSARKDAVFLDK